MLPMMATELFRDRLRRLRSAKGLDVGELARRVGVTEGAIRQMESGQTKSASFQVGVRLARVLGVDPGYLAAGEEAGVPISPLLAPDPEADRRGGAIAHPGQRETPESVKAFAVDLGERLTQIDAAILDVLTETLDALSLIEVAPEPVQRRLGRARERLQRLRGA